MQALSTLSSSGSERSAAPSWAPARRAAEPGAAVESARRIHDPGRHWHDGRRHAERGGHLDRRHEHGAARAELRLKIEQTIRQFTPTGAEGESDAAQEGASTLSATLKARIRAVADDGRIDARLKISVQWNGEGDAASFAQALEQFTQTVFGALQTLFGQPPRVGTDATNAAPDAAPDADGNAAAAAAVAATTHAPAAIAASTGSAEDVTPVNAPLPSPIDSPTTLPAAGAESRPAAATPTSTSISIRLRLTYGGFAAQVPTLVQQLARPDVESRAPALQPLLEDMRNAWARLWGAAAGNDGTAPALATFLAALGRNYSAGGPMVPLPAPSTTTGATTGALISTQA